MSQPKEMVFYASDLDGDRHLFASVPVEEARRWQVTYVHADGAREPDGGAITGFAPGRDDPGTPRLCWFADREPGSWYEFLLPDGSAFTAWADGNRDPAPPPPAGKGDPLQLSPISETAPGLLMNPYADTELASTLGMALEDFAEVFGTGWHEVLRFHDFDTDPTGGSVDGGEGALFGPWYVAGEPAQAMMRATWENLEIASPHGAWRGDVLVWEPHDIRSFPVRGWPRPEVRAALTQVLGSRRRLFTWCRYCHTLTAPENRYQRDVCSGCATRHMGIVY